MTICWKAPAVKGVEVIIIITNMLLYLGDLEREVTLWNCIQTRLTRRTSPGKG